MSESILRSAIVDAADSKKNMDGWKKMAMESVGEKMPLWKTVGAFHAALKHIENFSTDPYIIAEAKRGLDEGEKFFEEHKQWKVRKFLQDQRKKADILPVIGEANYDEIPSDEELYSELAAIENKLK